MPSRLQMLVLVAALASCGSDPLPATARPATPSTSKPKAVEKAEKEAAEAEPLLEYAYSPVGKRDPFRSVLDETGRHRPEDSSVNSNCGPLCKWEIEQLKLVAVISGISNPLAMVEDPAGKGHIVRRGTFIGKRNGKVTQIRSGEVVVTEIFKDQMGKPHVNPVYIRLPAEKSAEIEDQNLLGPEVAE
jgi:type IV pilus assembly protein PilP